MCSKYTASSLKTQSSDKNYHMLAQILKFSTTKMQCAHGQSRRLYMSGNVGLKEGEKKWTNDLKFLELIAKKTMEQPIMTQNENENRQHSNPK